MAKTVQAGRKMMLKVAEVCSGKPKPVKQASTALAVVFMAIGGRFVLQYK
jgi:hypothetical protein